MPKKRLCGSTTGHNSVRKVWPASGPACCIALINYIKHYIDCITYVACVALIFLQALCVTYVTWIAFGWKPPLMSNEGANFIRRKGRFPAKRNPC